MMTYFLILVLLIALELIYFRIADRFNIIDKPNERSSHRQVTLRGGGVVFLMGAWLWSLIPVPSPAGEGMVMAVSLYPWFLLGLTVIALVSFVDDLRSLPAMVRLLTQFATMALLFHQIGIDNGGWGIDSPLLLAAVGVVALVVAVGTANAYNFMDGINGITGGYSIAVLLPLLYLDTWGLAKTGLAAPFIEPSLLVVMLLAACVFCFFNFRKKARCFAGDVGSIGIAFVIIFALARLMVQTKDVTYIVFLAVYGVDTVLTICHRIMLHEHLSVAHRKHVYQLMVNELKIPHVVVSSVYAALQLVICMGFLWVDSHWAYLLIVVCSLGAVYVIFMRKYYHLHEEYLESLHVSDVQTDAAQ